MSEVLVVDDDETVANVVVGYLERAGHTARYLTDGQSALDAVAVAAPDLMVLDLMLPGVDGLEVCRRVRRSLPDLPVIMLTALAEAEDRIAGWRSARTTTSPSRSPRANLCCESTRYCGARRRRSGPARC